MPKILLCLLLIFSAFDCKAEEPGLAGTWLVKDKTAHIRLFPCGQKLWGVISWVQMPDTDKHNPDITRRNRPVLGMPILLGFEQDKNGGWNGDIYNADNGKIYQSHIHLKSENVLHVEGCVWGILCGGEDWTRLSISDPDVPDCTSLNK